MEKGLILVNTGNGKGKTTAALGLLVRATGHNKKCAVVQFIKSTDFTYGEKATLEKLGVELYTLGAGCTWNAADMNTAEAIVKTWEFARNLVLSDRYDIVVLDEINIALWFESKHPLSIDLKAALLRLLAEKPERLHLVLTGRYAPQEIMDAADMVTEMKMVKHHYEQGIPAMEGIEF
ncbi:MAG TPA: cob(I)yrinic acid a,c-diamide adenosyltransferase [Bacteroidales bacterium]|nr:cob(I)yrinic acid a,c-diamide adenosyltransferase [Bacteroidales bacterium]